MLSLSNFKIFFNIIKNAKFWRYYLLKNLDIVPDNNLTTDNLINIYVKHRIYQLHYVWLDSSTKELIEILNIENSNIL